MLPTNGRCSQLLTGAKESDRQGGWQLVAFLEIRRLQR